MGEDLRVLSEQGVMVGGMEVRPLPRVFSMRWRGMLFDVVKGVVEKADKPIIDDCGLRIADLEKPGSGVNFQNVLGLAEEILCVVPGAVAGLVAAWLVFQELDREAFKKKGWPKDLDGKLTAKDAELGLVLTEAEEQAILLQCVRYVFPLSELRQIVGLAKSIQGTLKAGTL